MFYGKFTKATRCAKVSNGGQLCKDAKIIGFKCDCGYAYSQTKPVLSSLPKTIHQNTNSEIYPKIKF